MRNQLARAEEELNETSQKLMKRESQLNQMNGEMTGLKFLEEEVNEKNMAINKLKGELNSIRIETSHMQ